MPLRFSNNSNPRMTFPFTQTKENTISAGGTVTINANDRGDIVVTTTSAVRVNLPSAADRNGVPVVIVGWSDAPDISIVADGLDTIIGETSIDLTTPRGTYVLKPRTDGWYQL